MLSWSDYAALVSRFADGLAAHGFGRGDRLAVIGDNRPRLYAAMLAAQSLGGAAVPLWPDAEPDWIAQVLNHAGVSIVVAEDDEQVEKIERGQGTTARASACRADDVARHAPARTRLAEIVRTVARCRTRRDRTTASRAIPRCCSMATARAARSVRVTLSHADLLAAAEALIAAEDVRQTDETLAWLPMAWFGDALASQALALSVGFTCNCPEHPETARRDLREIGPTILIAPPRIWESTLADIETRAAQATPLKRALFAHFRAVAERVERHGEAGEDVPVLLRLKLALGDLLVDAPMRDQIGLRRLRWAGTGGESLAPRVLHGVRALGIDLKQSHGVRRRPSAVREPAHA